jgi:uncharacterized protein (TIGR03437 family)
MTGEGATGHAVTGAVTLVAPAPPYTPPPLQPVTVLIGGAPASIQLAGEAPGLVARVMQLNVQIPANAASGNLPVSVSVGGISSPSGVTISVQ